LRSRLSELNLALGSDWIEADQESVVTPGYTDDGDPGGLLSESEEMVRNWHARRWTPTGSLSMPADIGNVVALLCSDDAAWITGQLTTADVGASLMTAELPLAIQWRDEFAGRSDVQ
jgi:enoyl-[acyl-carrier protein] reductase III